MIRHGKFHGAALCLALAWLASETRADESKVTNRRVSVAGFVDIGQIVKGSLDDQQTSVKDLGGTFLNRDGIALTYSGTLNDNLDMNIGVGGLFWKPIPENQEANSKRIGFGPGISEASAQYHFSDVLDLKFGFFGYKYNPDAVNLGEYLLKAEAYPTIVRTAGPGGWVWMNANEYKSMGAKLSWTMLGGALRHDFVLFSEFNDTPIFDFSPSYIATVKAGSAFEFGAGVSFGRFLPIKPSVATSHSPDNTYVKYSNFPEVQYHGLVISRDGSGAVIDTQAVAWRGTGSYDASLLTPDANRASTQLVVVQKGSPAGERGGILSSFTDGTTGACAQSGDPLDGCKTTYLNSTGDSVAVLDSAGVPTGAYVPAVLAKKQYLTFKGIKVMGRASLNLGSLIGMDTEHHGSFKLFAEAAVLGVQNQPVYYEKLAERIPIMVGADIPTFGLLNRLTIQAEYFKSPWPDNTFTQFQDALPQPKYPQDDPVQYQLELAKGTYKDDDLKWTVSLHRNLFTGLDMFAQVANDHFRVQNAFAEPSYVPVTHKKGDWYYMFRFMWSM